MTMNEARIAALMRAVAVLLAGMHKGDRDRFWALMRNAAGTDGPELLKVMAELQRMQNVAMDPRPGATVRWH